MSKANQYEQDILKLLFNGTAIANIADNTVTAPSTQLSVALHTADPGDAGSQTTSEAAYTSYARVATARSTAATGWLITNNSASPVSTISFPACTGSSADITHFSVGTSTSGAGKLFYSGTVTPNISVVSGVTPQLTTGSTINED